MADAMEYFSTQRVTMSQREVMVKFMRENNEFAMGRFSTLEGAKNRARLMREFSNKLNAVADGAYKSPEKWMKCWQDWKSDVKKKARRIQHQFRSNGRLQLTPLEEQVIQIMGAVAVCGQDTVDALDAADNKLLQEHQGSAVAILNPEPVASSSSVVWPSTPLHEVMDADSFSESECNTLPRSMESMDNMINPAELLNHQTALKEKQYKLELKRFEMELAREARQSRKEELELELARQATEASVKSASAMEAMALAVKAAMQSFQCYLEKQ